jgi:hypothetical protein
MQRAATFAGRGFRQPGHEVGFFKGQLGLGYGMHEVRRGPPDSQFSLGMSFNSGM